MRPSLDASLAAALQRDKVLIAGSGAAPRGIYYRDYRIMQVSKSNKLANVCYDIRGPVLKHAKRLEEEGHRILKLNIGNPAPFGFEAPE